jgi:hypothetical protein
MNNRPPISTEKSARRYQKLVVFHPSPNLVETIDDLFKNLAPSLKYENIVDPDLLKEAIRTGITENVRAKLESVITNIPLDPPTLIFVTCSTLGGIAEEIGRATNRNVIRIDRPMAEQAVNIGGKIGIAAALESTLEPTKQLLENIASEKGIALDIGIILCKDAWRYKQLGDDGRYISEIAKCLDAQEGKFDVIVLAQGSMAAAKDRTSTKVPVLSSPETGVARVIELMAQYNK